MVQSPRPESLQQLSSLEPKMSLSGKFSAKGNSSRSGGTCGDVYFTNRMGADTRLVFISVLNECFLGNVLVIIKQVLPWQDHYYEYS